MKCRARRYNDTMMCPCGLQWDVKDLEPPECQPVRNEVKYATAQDWADLKELLKQN